MTYHNFPFMASYFQLVENKNKNSSTVRLDITDNCLYFHK